MYENISEESFVKQLKENQNIIHKICRLYASVRMLIKDLFLRDNNSVMELILNLEAILNLQLGLIIVGLNTAITLYRKKKKH